MTEFKIWLKGLRLCCRRKFFGLFEPALLFQHASLGLQCASLGILDSLPQLSDFVVHYRWSRFDSGARYRRRRTVCRRGLRLELRRPTWSR